MSERLRNIIDYFSIIIGISSMIISFFFHLPDFCQNIVYLLCGLLGLYYISYGGILWFGKRIDFDRHLVYGHFLRKVVCLVLLLPFTMTALVESIKVMFPKSNFVCDLPEELFYDEKLYNDGLVEKKDTVLIKDSLSLGILKEFAYVNGDEIIEDSLYVNKSKVPGNKSLETQPPSPFWPVFYHFIDPGNQHVTVTDSGRGWAALFAILGVFLLNGLLVSSIVNWVDARNENRQNGDVRYSLKDFGKYKFAVVIGANEIAASVIKNLLTIRKNGDINYKCESDNRYVLLQTSRDVKKVREELSSHLTEDDLKKVVIYKALRNSKSELKSLFPAFATEIYVLGESTLIDNGETYHDALNMRCINLLAEILKEYAVENSERYARRVCKVMFEYQTTYSIFQFSDISNDINNYLVFIPFNIYESWAHNVIVDGKSVADCSCDDKSCNSIEYMPLDGNGIKKDSLEHVHFVIVGMSKIGVAMGIQALLQAHYVNFADACITGNNDLRKRTRTRITFIDTNADKEMDFFKGRYDNLFNLMRYRYIDAGKSKDSELQFISDYGWTDPFDSNDCKWKHLSDDGQNFIDVEMEFIKGELESEGVRMYLNNISDNKKDSVDTSKLTIAICLQQTHQAVAASLYMPVSIYEKAQQIWVYQHESADIILNLLRTNLKDRRYKRLRPFGMMYGEYMSDRTLYLKALLVNGAYDLGNIKNRNMADKNSYRDLRHSWKKLTIDKKFSNKYFVDSILVKIRSVSDMNDSMDAVKEKLKDSEELLACCEHNRWNVQQLILGYYPCDKNVDKEFQELEKERKTNSSFDKKNFKMIKDYYKEGEYRSHPNICDYKHLDLIDEDAKNYDKNLNNAIPEFIRLVDRI